MTQTEIFLIRRIRGTWLSRVQPMALTLDEIVQHVYLEGNSDILLGKDCYPQVAACTGMNEKAVARAVERTAWKCWNCMLQNGEKDHYLGASFVYKTPKQFLIHLAYYLHYHEPLCP